MHKRETRISKEDDSHISFFILAHCLLHLGFDHFREHEYFNFGTLHVTVSIPRLISLDLEQVYDEEFAKKYGYFRPYIKQVIYRYLDCGILHNGFARVKCEECGHEFLLAFSCKRRHFCPSCHQKRVVKTKRGRSIVDTMQYTPRAVSGNRRHPTPKPVWDVFRALRKNSP